MSSELPPQSRPTFGKRAMDKSQPLSSWIKFQLRMLHDMYPRWEGMVILALVVFSVVMALSFADEGSMHLKLRDWLEALWLRVVTPRSTNSRWFRNSAAL